MGKCGLMLLILMLPPTIRCLSFPLYKNNLLLLCFNLKCCVKCSLRKPKFLLINVSHFFILQVPFSRIVYIEKTDFRLKDSKDYYGLAPGKSVMLRYPLFFLRKFIWIYLPIYFTCSIFTVIWHFFPLVARYAFPIKCTDVIYGDSPDDIVEIRAEYDPLKTSKLKVTVHWNLFETVWAWFCYLDILQIR